MLAYWMRRHPASDKWNNISYALIIVGAVGNVFDRIVHGFVVDYLDFTGEPTTGQRSIWTTL